MVKSPSKNKKKGIESIINNIETESDFKLLFKSLLERIDTDNELLFAINHIEKKINTFKTLSIPQVDWELYALLRRLGLTKYEILAYTSLILENGSQTISEIAKSGIPQPRVYDVVESLIKYGLVEESKSGRPRKYRPIPPREGLDNLMGFFIEAKERVLKRLESMEKRDIPEFGGIWEIRSKTNLTNTAKRIMKSAKNEILVVLDYSTLKYLIPILKELYSNNIIISAIIKSEGGEKSNGMKWGSGDDSLIEFFDWINFLKIRYVKTFSIQKSTAVIIVDRKYALQWGIGSSTGQEIENVDIIDTIVDYFFFSNWRQSKPLSDLEEYRRKYPLSTVYIQTAIEEIDFILNKDQKAFIHVIGIERKTGRKINEYGEAVRTETNWDSGKFSVFLISNEKFKSIGGKLASSEDICAERIIIDRKQIN